MSKSFYPSTFLITTLFQKKNKKGRGVQDMEFEEKEVKKEVDFLRVIKKK